MQNTEFHDDIFMRICDYPCSFPSPTPPAPSSLVTFLHHLQTFLQCHVLCLVILLVPGVCCLGSHLHRASFPSRLVMLQTDRERCLRGVFALAHCFLHLSCAKKNFKWSVHLVSSYLCRKLLGSSSIQPTSVGFDFPVLSRQTGFRKAPSHCTRTHFKRLQLTSEMRNLPMYPRCWPAFCEPCLVPQPH